MPYQPDKRAADFLLSAEARPYLEQAAAFSLDAAHNLANLARLRAELPAELAAAVLEQATLRRKAASKFDRAAAMLFTADGLQQASSLIVARHRANRLTGMRVADLTCGLGGDAVAIAEVAAQTIALDRDALRLRFARHNLDTYGLTANFVQADALQPSFDVALVDTIYADPGRRSERGRIFSPRDYQPPLDELYRIYSNKLVAKVAPGIDYTTLDWPAEVEIVSLRGEVKEAVLWGRSTILTQTSDLYPQSSLRRATLLPSGNALTSDDAPDECSVASAGRYLYEPDGAIIRAGLVRNLANRLGLWQLDPQIAYLSSDAAVTSPLVRRFTVEQAAPFSLKALTTRLRELSVGIVEIKKRGLDIDPDALRQRLKLHGPNSRTVILTRIGNQPMMYICQGLGLERPRDYGNNNTHHG